MEELVGMAVNPIWWVSVVLVGVLISIFAAYMKTWIDRFLGFFSNAWKQRSARKNKEFFKELERLQADPHQQLITMSRANYYNSRGQWSGLVAAMVMIMLTSLPVGTIGLGLFVTGMAAVFLLIVMAGSDILQGLKYKNYVDNLDD